MVSIVMIRLMSYQGRYEMRRSVYVHTLLCFHSYPLLLMKTLPVRIAPFSNKNAIKTIGVHNAPVELVLLFPFSKQCLLSIVVIKAPMATLNAIVINSLLTKEYAAFSNFSVYRRSH